jgi:hypothetical protein
MAPRSACSAAAALALSVCAALPAIAAPSYSLVSTFDLPTDIDIFSIAPDGHILAMSGDTIRRQSGIGSVSFSNIGSVAPGLLNSFGASFISASPDGQTIAIGDNNLGSAASVHLIQASALDPGSASATTQVLAQNFSAAWSGNSTLFVTGGEFGSPSVVSAIDATTGTASTAISNIDGASSGIAVSNGFLYTGNGFEYGGGSSTGDIFAFDLNDLGAGPVDFLSGGTPVANSLSAGSLGFDGVGNLLVGGGNFGGEIGFAAVIDADAIASALTGGPLAASADGQQLSPTADPSAFHSIQYNPVTEELYVTVFGSSTVFVYAIPTPGALGLMGLAGLAATRRRRG